MSEAPVNYRWNSSDAAEAYDAAAPSIHPFYAKVQDEILGLLPFNGSAKFELADIGCGSGRLAERVLTQFAGARVTLVDQSAPFLAIAERRLARFGARARFIQLRLQDWGCNRVSLDSENRVSEKLDYDPATTFDVIVSTSAIHHLESAEKRALYTRCFEALAPGGMFINGDEYRPVNDQEYLALNDWWWGHMKAGLNDGRIPETFRATLTQWHDRNITRFAEPKKSGDDCLETADVQTAYLRDIGFADIRLTWQEKLWGVLVARR